jgi:Flp pilus assembly protein TadD
MRAAVRVGLAVVGVAAVVWLALGLRASRLEARGIALATANPSPAVVPASLQALKDAEQNNADTQPLLLQGELFIFVGQDARAIPPLLAVVRREPENFEAWRLLSNAADAAHNPALAARAQHQTLVLSPPVPSK